MKYNNYCFLVLALIVFYLETGTSLECYTCSSLTHPTCGNEFDGSKLSVLPCPGNDSVCVKITGEVGDLTLISRSCGVNTTCEVIPSCFTCTTDKCNSSSNLNLHFWLLPLLGFALITSLL